MKDSPGVEWITRAGAILWYVEDDEPTEEQLDELWSLAPYSPFNPGCDHELHKQKALEYLNKMLPNMSADDKNFAAGSFIFRCVACYRHYPTWWISKKEWRKSVSGSLEVVLDKLGVGPDGFFQDIYLCKECFEEIERMFGRKPPRYFTINQYIAYRLMTHAGAKKERKPEWKRVLSQIWDLPPA